MAAKLIFGCGYLGERVAQRWITAKHTVFATTRGPERAELLASRGIQPIILDVTKAFRLPNHLPPIDTVLFAVGFDRQSDQSIDHVYVDGLRNTLSAIPHHIQKIIYISSTGVYGDAQAEWIDERTPCHPNRPGGKASLRAEQLLTQHSLASRRVILRLAGIYGPNRLPKIKDILNNVPIEVSSSGWINLIHVDDAADVVVAADQFATAPALYNVSDGHPVVRMDFYCELARLLAAPPPRFVEPLRNTLHDKRGASDKRVSNETMLRELPVTLKFPSYREGLAAIAADMHNDS